MDIEILTAFFMWCTIINGSIYAIWVIVWGVIPDLVYSTQSKWFTIPRETFNVIIYSFLGLFKIFFTVFNVTPYIALLIIR